MRPSPGTTRSLRWVLATPQFHHWHHGAEREAVDKNFAVHLPVLDRLFGTCYMPGDRWPASMTDLALAVSIPRHQRDAARA